MNPSNSKIPTFNLDVGVEKASPSIRNRTGKTIKALLSRDITGLVVPQGNSITLTKGMEVEITQALGSSYTLAVEGSLVRIDGEDGDAFGQEKKGLLDTDIAQTPLNEQTIKRILKTVYDPEIPVNIFDLGLIYNIALPEPNCVTIDMTLTNPGCGMGEVLVKEVQLKLKKHPSVEHCEVNLVFSPPWDRSMLSTAAKLELGLI